MIELLILALILFIFAGLMGVLAVWIGWSMLKDIGGLFSGR